MADLYRTLGVNRDASEKEIRAAYRRLARRYHPDVNPGDAEAEERFKEINAAHRVLSDTQSREKYDRYGDQWQHAEEIEQIRRRQRPGGEAGFSFNLNDLFGGGRGAGPGPDVEDILGGGESGIFGRMFHRGGGRAGRQRGRDIEHTVRVTLEEAAGGTTRRVEITDDGGLCRVCDGSGQVAGATCHACRGGGSVRATRRLEVTIPAGIHDGGRVRLAGKGGAGAAGGRPGDLYLRVSIAPHPTFVRRGDELELGDRRPRLGRSARRRGARPDPEGEDARPLDPGGDRGWPRLPARGTRDAADGRGLRGPARARASHAAAGADRPPA